MPDRNDSTPPPSETDALRERAERAERERDALRRELERVRRENERLRKELDAARRAGKRQAAPFSKNRPAPHPQRPGRKPGAAYGRRAHRAAPSHIDEHDDAPLPPTCPAGAGAVRETGVIHPGRGFDEAAALLGADCAGVLVRDGWAPYRQFDQAAHQTCVASALPASPPPMHRWHGLPFAVVEESLKVLTGAVPLDTSTETIRESIEELTEPIEQRSRAARIHARQRTNSQPESTVRRFGSRCTSHLI